MTAFATYAERVLPTLRFDHFSGDKDRRRPPTQLTEADRQNIVALYPELTMSQIARDYRLHEGTVSRILKEAGRKPRCGRQSRKRFTMSDSQCAEAIRLHDKGEPWKSIAKRFHGSEATLRRCLQEYAQK